MIIKSHFSQEEIDNLLDLIVVFTREKNIDESNILILAILLGQDMGKQGLYSKTVQAARDIFIQNYNNRQTNGE